MALRSLELRKELDSKRADLTRAEENIKKMELREADLSGQIETATDETRDGIEAEVNQFVEEKKNLGADIQTLRDAIASLERELAELEEDAPSNNESKIERKLETMSEIMTRDSKQYVDAYARYIKTGSDKELRSLLSENAAEEQIIGVAVPSIVESTVKHAWEQTGIMSLVRKTYIKGNVKVGFEMSATGAVVHHEGENAPDEEELKLGIITLFPESVKKWITISDEAMDMGGADFLQYIYSELTYRIAKKVEDDLVAFIANCTDIPSPGRVGVKSVTAAPALGTVALAIANLSDEAANPVIVMNKLTYAAFKEAQYAANYGADIFEGLKVVFNNSLPAYSAATSGAVYMIVGDFGHGAQANFPAGESIGIKMDDVSLAEKDLVKLVGRCYVGAAPVAPFAFTNIKKA